MRPGDHGEDPWEGSEPDRPIDIEALRDDDELIESLVAGVIRAPHERSAELDPEAELRALLSAWVVDVRPETVTTTDLPEGPVRLPAPFRAPEAEQVAPPAAIPITAARHRAAAPPMSARRLAVAAAAVVLLGSGLAVSAWEAEPGGTLWPVAKVFYAERAKSIQAAADVNTGLQRARTALADGRKTDAAAAIATVVATLGQVAPEQGHDLLAQQQQDLVVALDDPALLAQAIAATPGVAAPLTDRAAERTPTPAAPAAVTPAPVTSDATSPVVPPADPAPSPVQTAPPADPQPVDPQPVDPQPVGPQQVTPPPRDPVTPAPVDPPPPGTTPPIDSGNSTGPADTPAAQPAGTVAPTPAPAAQEQPAVTDVPAPPAAPAPAEPTGSDQSGPAPSDTPSAAATDASSDGGSSTTSNATSNAPSDSANGGTGPSSPGLVKALLDTVTSIVGAIFP